MSFIANVLNTAQVTEKKGFRVHIPSAQQSPVNRTVEGKTFVQIRDIPPAEVIVLANHS